MNFKMNLYLRKNKIIGTFKIFIFTRRVFGNSILFLSKISITLLFLYHCSIPSDLYITQDNIDRIFDEKGIIPMYGNCSYRNKKLSYTETTIHSESMEIPIVVFIHGSPGSWNNFLYYLYNKELLKHARIISFDRFGYGFSDPGNPEGSLFNHAHAIADCLNEIHNNTKWILVGHSYGGPVAGKIAMDFPGNTKEILLLAASIDPSLEKKEWFNSMAEWWVMQYLLPQDLLTSNVEILALKEELNLILPDWKKIKARTTIIHGEKDSLVPYANVEFAKKNLLNANIVLNVHPAWNHFLPWNQKEVVLESILKATE